MDEDFQFEQYRSRLVGGVVRKRRLLASTLALYVDCTPGAAAGFVIWIDPAWHLRDSERVLTGSRTAQDSGEEDYPEEETGFERAANALEALVGRRILELQMDPVSGELRLEFTGGFEIRTFVTEPADDHLWHIDEGATGESLQRGGSGWVPC